MPADTATRIIPHNAPPNQRPDYKRPEYVEAERARKITRALTRGSAGVRALGEVGLPKWPAEAPEHYKIRANGVQVTRYYARTVEATVGMIVASPPTLADGTDPVLVADWEDIDGRGTHGEVFTRKLVADSIHGGFSGILVDAPPVHDDLAAVMTLEDEQALGIRPFWVNVPAERVINWTHDAPDWPALLAAYRAGLIEKNDVKRMAGQSVLRKLVIYEPKDVEDGEFGIKVRERYRVLKITNAGVTYDVWEKRTGSASEGEHFVCVADGMLLKAKRKPWMEIPFAIDYGGLMERPLVADPPLLGLAELNLDHYQVSADRRYLMRLCHAPTLFLAGFADALDETGTGTPAVIKVGPNSVLRSSEANAKAEYVAANPNALDSSQTEKEDLVHGMAAIGSSFIRSDRRGSAETATGRQLDDAAENSSHAVAARGAQDALENAWRFHAGYRGVNPPEITVNTTYAAPNVDAQIAAVLWQAVLADKIDVDTWLTYIRTGQLPDDFDAAAYALTVIASADAQAGANADVMQERATGSAPEYRAAA